MSQSKDLKKALIIYDCHRPWHRVHAYKLMLEAAHDLQVDEVDIVGDYADIYWLSSHRKDPSIHKMFQDEVNDIISGLDEIDKYFPRAKKIYCCGNHEKRLERYLQDKAPELFGFITYQQLVGLDKRFNWIWVPYTPDQRYPILGSDLYIRHEPLGNNSNMSAMRAHCSHIYGHTHRREESQVVSLTGQRYIALSGGWMGDERKDQIFGYVQRRNQWALGFSIVYFSEETRLFYIDNIQIQDNMTCVVNGKLFKA